MILLGRLPVTMPMFHAAATGARKAILMSRLPRDILKIQNADLFIISEGESDMWVDQILSSLGDKNPRTLVILHSVNALPEEGVPGMQAEEESPISGEAEVVYDEHIWTSPLNAIKMVDAITVALSELDPAHAADFENNRAALDQKLQELDQTFRDIVKTAKRKPIIVGDRFLSVIYRGIWIGILCGFSRLQCGS
jgi:zinc transport system substrate-binding protein